MKLNHNISPIENPLTIRHARKLIARMTTEATKVKKQTSSKKIIASKLLTKGFFINTLNPNALLIWCGAATILLQFEIENKLSSVSIVLYYVGIQFMIILTDIFKLYLGHQIKSFLSEQHLFYIRFVSSSIFILFGIYLLL